MLRTASVDGVEASTVSGRVGAELDPETVRLGRDCVGGVVAAHSSQYRAVLVTVSHLSHTRTLPHKP